MTTSALRWQKIKATTPFKNFILFSQVFFLGNQTHPLSLQLYSLHKQQLIGKGPLIILLVLLLSDINNDPKVLSFPIMNGNSLMKF